VTSIAEPRPAARGRGLRGLLLVFALALFAVWTPMPWAGLWLLVPAATAVALLLAWRFGRIGWLLPIGLAIGAFLVEGADSLWAWWVPAAAASGAWMGSTEERGATSGRRAWMLLPVLVLAAALPWAVHYRDLIGGLEREVRSQNAETVEMLRGMGASGERLASLQRSIAEMERLLPERLPRAVPTLLFLWVALLVVAGRAIAARVGVWLRWPALRPGFLRDWRLPDGALWTLIAGLGLVLSPWNGWAPTAWTLLLNAGLGFCVQGMAVVESLMLARGIPLSIIVLTMLFVLTIALPLFVITTAALGLSDVWLDFRRLEAAPVGDGA
jgi:predicted membrane protein DUF2232